MKIDDVVSLRRILENYENTSFGFKGIIYKINEDNLKVLSQFQEQEIREIYYTSTNESFDFEDVTLGENVTVAIDLKGTRFYYNTFEEFIRVHKFKYPESDYYIHELEYFHGSQTLIPEIRKYQSILEIIEFLSELSDYRKAYSGKLELLFNTPSEVSTLKIDYDKKQVLSLDIEEFVDGLKLQVLDKSDADSRKRLFINELVNLVGNGENSFSSVLKNWNEIVNSYKKSFQIYLAEFSFEKIKTSSQEYFHELTDRIYSTINKFSTYILAIPLAYIFILRFFDFNGNSFAKDTFLIVAGLFYFTIIWFVLLNNLVKAFESIESDITKFQKRIENEDSLVEIHNNLYEQKEKVIPNQKRKVLLVRVISLIVLILTFSAYCFIHWTRIQTWIWDSVSC